MLTFNQAGDLLDQMAERFPPEFYRDLNGGISLLPEALRQEISAGKGVATEQELYDFLENYSS